MGAVNAVPPPPTDPAPASPNELSSPSELLRGEQQTRALLWALGGLVALPTLAALLQGRGGDGGGLPLARDALYLVATAVLLRGVWRGSVWSWRIAVALSMFTGMLVVMAGLFAGRTALQGLLVGLGGIGFLACGLLLVADGPVRRFLETRWAARSRQLRGQRA